MGIRDWSFHFPSGFIGQQVDSLSPPRLGPLQGFNELGFDLAKIPRYE